MNERLIRGSVAKLLVRNISMSTTEMPATEAVVADELELASYELAYHVLPTVAEGEVSTIRDVIAAAITGVAGTIDEEEAPQRVDLAYEIIKPVEGKNRRFTSAYFGWVRFTVAPEAIGEIAEAVSTNKQILRHLVIRLTKAELEHPFFYHEAMAAERQVSDVEVADEIEADIDPNAEVADETVDVSDVTTDAKVESTGTDTAEENPTAETEDVPKTSA